MINRTEAERIAAAINIVRPDWPARSLLTLIERDLAHWAYLDILVGLAYVAGERNLDGTWASRTPARVKEDGRWRQVGVGSGELEAARERDRQARAEREREREQRRLAIADCQHCDDQGKVAGHTCNHQPELAEIARRGAAVARSEVRRPPEAISDGTTLPMRSRAWGPIGMRQAPTKESQRIAVLEREDLG